MRSAFRYGLLLALAACANPPPLAGPLPGRDRPEALPAAAMGNRTVGWTTDSLATDLGAARALWRRDRQTLDPAQTVSEREAARLFDIANRLRRIERRAAVLIERTGDQEAKRLRAESLALLSALPQVTRE